jgi:hypothetical protein
MRPLVTILLFCGSLVLLQTDHDVLTRQYHEGEKLVYRMKGINETWRYQTQASGVVKKDSTGSYFEEYGWSNFISNDALVSLPPASMNFRQQLTLDPKHNPSVPNLAAVDLRLIGPITDWMTVYSDLWLANRTGQLTHAGDHFHFSSGTANSWADGTYVLIGEDSIDFDFTLKAVNQSNKTATIVVQHVPPAKPQVKLPAPWMETPVADTPHNWVEVKKNNEGKYTAAVGKETFDVVIHISLVDGKILSATIDNPVKTQERECADAALTQCGAPKPHNIRRQIEIALEH